jgi:hypothetical protein
VHRIQQDKTKAKTYGHLGEIATEDTGDVMRGVGLVFPIKVFAVLEWRCYWDCYFVAWMKTDSGWRFKDALEIPHALVGPVDSKYALDFGCW